MASNVSLFCPRLARILALRGGQENRRRDAGATGTCVLYLTGGLRSSGQNFRED
jgi:hypothetical protein